MVVDVLSNTELLEELKRFNMTEATYEAACKDIDDKLNGLNDLDWIEIQQKYDIHLNPDTIRKANNSPFGASFRLKWLKSKNIPLNTESSDLDAKLYEIRKEKQKLYDERTGLNKLLREQARREELFDIVKRAIEDYQPIKFEYSPIAHVDSDADMIIHLSDVHAGVEIDSMLNKFNTDILVERIRNYISEVLDIREIYNAENAYIILGGDMIQGLIHLNGRIETKENVVEQIELVSDIIGNFIDKLRHKFKNVYVFTTPGNHSRSTASKEESRRGENFDLLVPYVLKKQFRDVTNVNIVDNTLDVNIATFNVRGWNVYAAHGDKDTVNNVVTNMTKLARRARLPLPDMCYLGHRHSNSLTTVDEVKVIQSGCIDGMDSYAIDGRFVGAPEQIVTVVTANKRIKALCDIQLD